MPAFSEIEWGPVLHFVSIPEWLDVTGAKGGLALLVSIRNASDSAWMRFEASAIGLTKVDLGELPEGSGDVLIRIALGPPGRLP